MSEEVSRLRRHRETRPAKMQQDHAECHRLTRLRNCPVQNAPYVNGTVTLPEIHVVRAGTRVCVPAEALVQAHQPCSGYGSVKDSTGSSKSIESPALRARGQPVAGVAELH